MSGSNGHTGTTIVADRRPDPTAPADGDARTTRRGTVVRVSATLLVALAGLAVIILGPTGLAVGWHEHTQEQAAAEQAKHPLGSEVRDGPASFVVHEVRCGADDETRHGQRCVATVAVRNDGEETLRLPGVQLHSPDGVRHVPAAADPAPFGTLEPGDSTTSAIEFDLPPHAEVTHVGVRADPYSSGVAVFIGDRPLPLLPD